MTKLLIQGGTKEEQNALAAGMIALINRHELNFEIGFTPEQLQDIAGSSFTRINKVVLRFAPESEFENLASQINDNDLLDEFIALYEKIKKATL